MHNHFVIKSLTFLKPGGLLAILTSRYTMDAQDPSAREEMAGLHRPGGGCPAAHRGAPRRRQARRRSPTC